MRPGSEWDLLPLCDKCAVNAFILNFIVQRQATITTAVTAAKKFAHSKIEVIAHLC